MEFLSGPAADGRGHIRDRIGKYWLNLHSTNVEMGRGKRLVGTYFMVTFFRGAKSVSLLAAFLGLTACQPLLAGAQPAGSQALNGSIVDPSGAAIVGAMVKLVQNGRFLTQISTQNDGGFHFGKLTAGNYELEIHVDGFRDARITLALDAKQRDPIRVVMSIATDNEVVTVGGESVPIVSTDVAENRDANVVDREELDRVPLFDQDYIATMSRFLNEDATGTNGVTLVVNGVEANGPGVTASAVQQVKINQNPYSARFSRPGRARLEIITKGGTPQYHGSLNFLFRDSVFDARNTFAIIKPPEQRRYLEGSVTGPVGRSKSTTFLLSLDEDQQDQQGIVRADGPDGLINESVANPTRHFFGSGRVFHDLANGDLLSIGYSYERRTITNQGVGGTVLPSAGYDTRFQEHEISVSDRHLISSRWINQLRFLIGHNDVPVTSVSSAPQVTASGAFTSGGAQADSRRTEYHFDGGDLLTYASGRHEISFGIDVPDISRRGFDDFTNRSGTYTFDGLASYLSNQPSTYVLQRGQGHVVFLERVLAGIFEDNVKISRNFSIYAGVRYYWQNYFHDDSNNVAPRVGFAYAPGKGSKTVIRGGAGVFYDRSGPGSISDLLHFNGVNLFRYIVENPSYPITPAEIANVPTSVVLLDPRAHIPYTVQYSAGVERQITHKSTLSATYVGSRGIDLFRSLDSNAPLKMDIRPNPAIGQERDIQSDGYQKSNGLELTFRGKPGRFFNGQVQYTFSKTYNNTGGIGYFPANSYDPAADWALSDNDRRHKLDLLGSVPVDKYFNLGLALSLYSGKPVNVTTGGDDNHDGIANDRPAGMGRNSLPGPGLIGLDLSMAHDFTIAKSAKEPKILTVALNSFNVLNHENDQTYIGVVTSRFFGHAVAAQPPRRMQLDVQFKF